MSRIAGLVHRIPHAEAPATLLASMVAGQAAQRSWFASLLTDGQVAFGWTGWRKPKLTRVDHLLVVVDGCLYNRHEFSGYANEPTLIASIYLEHGFPDTIRRFNGDFSIALFDSHLNSLWLARDRFGVKPLYYVWKRELFAFASQPGALLTLPHVGSEPDRTFVALFAAFHYRYFDNNPERSSYAEVAQVPAGHCLQWTPNGVTKTRYWTLEEELDYQTSETELAACYRDLLEDAVSLRLQSAGRPAFTLSGGMDSSSVLSLAMRASGTKQHAFSTVYPDKTYDESEEITSMLDAAVEQWHTVLVDPDDIFDLVERMVCCHDEPVATATWLSHFIMCEAVANEGFAGLFGGLGGDELNAGEYEHFLYFFADLQAAGQSSCLDREIQAWIRYHDHPIFQKSRNVVDDGFRRAVNLSQQGACRPDPTRLLRYASVLNPDYYDPIEFSPVMDHPFSSYLKNRTYQDIFRETAPCCLRAEDRQTTAFGLDHYLPFFDYRVVEFMFRIPGNLKIRHGVTKFLLREAMKGILPEETRVRVKKMGWNAPAHKWFSGAGRERLLDMVRSQAFRQRHIYRQEPLEALINEHDEIVRTGATRDNHMMFLWQLVNLETWLIRIPLLSRKQAGEMTFHTID